MANRNEKPLTRRAILKGSLIAGGASLFGFRDLRLPFFFGSRQENSFQAGRFLGLIEFAGEASIPVDTAMGAGLDGRLYTDLSKIGPSNPTIPNDKFYVRTGASEFLKDGEPGRIEVTGLLKQPTKITVAEVKKMSRPAGLHLLECSGNVRDAHFGMLSVADWSGAPVSDILDSIHVQHAASHILISGFDRYPDTSTTSEPGASSISLSTNSSPPKPFSPPP